MILAVRRRSGVVLAGAFLVLVSCNALTGAGDLRVGSEDGVSEGGAAGEAGANGEAGASGGDGGATEDGASFDASVRPTLAECGTDRVCLPSTNGWTPALYVIVPTSSACPAEWPQKNTYRTSGGGSCSCNCAPTSGSCDGPLEVRNGPNCSGAATTVSFASGVCTARAALGAPLSLRAKPTNPPTACAGTPRNDLDPPESAMTCSGAVAEASAACGSGEVCVPKPASGFPLPSALACIARAGDVPCPAELPYRIVVGDDVQDQRSCAASCTCKTTDCTDGKLEAFVNEGCTTGVGDFDVDGDCVNAGSANAMAYKYTRDPGCKVDQRPAVLGRETVIAPRTLCCARPF